MQWLLERPWSRSHQPPPRIRRQTTNNISFPFTTYVTSKRACKGTLFLSRDSELWRMTFAFQNYLNTMKKNQLVEYLVRWLFSSNVIVRTLRHTHRNDWSTWTTKIVGNYSMISNIYMHSFHTVDLVALVFVIEHYCMLFSEIELQFVATLPELFVVTIACAEVPENLLMSTVDRLVPAVSG